MVLRDVVVVGAGPAGLATAIAAAKSGLSCQVIEKGALVNSLLHYPTEMVFFTTPELMEIGGMPFVSPYDKPTRLEALRYYRRVSDAYELDVVFDETVVAITRDTAVPDADGALVVDTRSARGVRRSVHGRTVVVATGAYDFPNRLGVPGEDLPHVSHYYTQPHPFFRKKVVIVGGKNSAAEAALDLYRAGAKVTIVHRGAAMGESIKYWVKPDIDNRIREGSIPARFGTRVVEIRPTTVVVERDGAADEIEADAVFLLTGYGADTSLLRAAGIEIDAATCGPVFDSETFETNVPGVYTVGAMVAGVQSGRIFIENGRFHGQKAIEAIASRLRG
jgi:thioredoxin reductase (NADPH)